MTTLIATTIRAPDKWNTYTLYYSSFIWTSLESSRQKVSNVISDCLFKGNGFTYKEGNATFVKIVLPSFLKRCLF